MPVRPCGSGVGGVLAADDRRRRRVSCCCSVPWLIMLVDTTGA
ncbi:hypothetical protein [Rhodococcus sp. JVH1]|nr:hypothetical protein JVH1_3830 [Rhodococcus sp. JVH1]